MELIHSRYMPPVVNAQYILLQYLLLDVVCLRHVRHGRAVIPWRLLDLAGHKSDDNSVVDYMIWSVNTLLRTELMPEYVKHSLSSALHLNHSTVYARQWSRLSGRRAESQLCMSEKGGKQFLKTLRCRKIVNLWTCGQITVLSLITCVTHLLDDTEQCPVTDWNIILTVRFIIFSFSI